MHLPNKKELIITNISEKLLIDCFIHNFKASNAEAIEDNFLNGNCYWFAKILEWRFGGTIFYCPIENHFIANIDDCFFDIRGEITPTETPVAWSAYQNVEPTAAERIRKNCILQLYTL